MSRSRKKNLCGGFTCKESDKPFKIDANRKFRRKIKNEIKEYLKKMSDENNEEITFSKIEEISNIYSSPKDGKHWYKIDKLDEDYIKKLKRK